VNLPRASVVSFVLCVAGSASLVLGCYATVSPRPVEITSADDVVYGEPPTQIETYPVVSYEGRPHYYAEGRWYLRTSRGWGYYRNEPPHLAQRRPPQRHEERRPPQRQEDRHDDRREDRR
jgi:hypothetical protein